MIKLFTVASLAILLSGCATMSRSEIRDVIISRCPVLVNYTPEQQKMAAEELRKLYDNSQLAIMISDYSKLREACRLVNKRVKNRLKKV